MTQHNKQTASIKDETRFPFVMIPRDMIDLEDDVFDDATEKMVYIVLKRFANLEGENAFPSAETIAKKAICSRKTVYRKVETLVKKGLITKVNRFDETSGAKTSNLYSIRDINDWMGEFYSAGNEHASTRENDVDHGTQSPIPRDTESHGVGTQSPMPRDTESHKRYSVKEIHIKDIKKNSSKRKKRVYNDDDAEMILSKFFESLIKQHDEKFKVSNIQTWCDHIRLTMERDGRDYDEIRDMMEWCQRDSFWQSNILSTKKLREKFPTLLIQSKTRGGKSHATNGRHDGIDRKAPAARDIGAEYEQRQRDQGKWTDLQDTELPF